MELEDYIADLRRRQDKNRPAGTSGEVQYRLGQITLPRHIDHWADAAPERNAIIFQDRAITYADLATKHQSLASWLLANGVEPGDRVAVHLPNSVEFIIAFLAILRIGAVHVPVNPMFQAGEIAHEVNDAEPALIITSQALSGVLDQARDRIGNIPRLAVDDTAWNNALSGERYHDCADDLEALAALNYTGGTTGLPKGCCHTQGHMLYTAASAASANNIDADGQYVALCYLPIFWIAGEDLGIILPLVLGGTVVLMARWNAQEALEAIENHAVTVLLGTVENYLELMEQPGIEQRDLSSLTDPQAMSFVKKLTPDVRRAWADIVPGSVLREAAYGLTETHTLDTSPYGFGSQDYDLLAEPVFCGLPVPGTDIGVVSPDTGEPMPIGEVGEIIVRSPSVTTGYWRNQDATEQQLRNGWIHTGDSGRMNDLGCLHYLGREKEMIKVKGMSVFPAEIEMLLSQHRQVASVAVIGEDDAQRGQCPIAFVLAKEGENPTAAELESWSQDNMAAYKVPRVRIVDAFPMTDTGKVRKNALAAETQKS